VLVVTTLLIKHESSQETHTLPQQQIVVEEVTTKAIKELVEDDVEYS